MRPVVIALITIVSAAEIRAQDSAAASYDIGREDRFAATAPQPFRLRPFVMAGSESVWLAGTRLDSTAYSIDYRFGLLTIPDAVNAGDSVRVAYRSFPVAFRDVYRVNSARDDTSVGDALQPIRRERSGPRAAGDPFGGGNLRRRGSITRGVIAGNRQDATIESGLRMELSGEIVDGVDLRAVLTDENTPILPEGTTQRISEIDRVFIEVTSSRGSAQLGDFDFALSASEFAQFNRKLQGARVRGTIPGGGGIVSGTEVVVAGATSRGTYRSQTLEATDGVQGPYRLEGESGERFIIVVPGTEEVYVDGRRLTRGETNDYVIDYSTAEISFTPSQIITANKRIVVEFQYSTNQFTRSLVGTHVRSTFGQPRAVSGHLSATFLREADSRDFSEEFGLTSADSALLVVSGDEVATRSGAERVEYDPEALFVQYTREPVMAEDGSVDTVFVAISIAPPEGTEVYRVRFSRVGEAGGSYVRTGRSVNGIVYEYRGPGRGDYDPVRQLPKPKRQQLFDLAGGVSPVRGVEMFGVWAHSVYDENRLSSIDAEDDQGSAYTVGGRVKDVRTGIGGSRLSLEARRRFVGSHFRSFNRIRSVEFTREWGLDLSSVGVSGGNTFGSSEITHTVDGSLAFSDKSGVSGGWAEIRFSEFFDASRQSFGLELSEARAPALSYRLERIVSRDALANESGDWLRQHAELRYDDVVGKLTPSVEFEHEDRRQRDDEADVLTMASLAFVEFRPAVSWRSERFEAGGGVDWRREKLALNGFLRDAATGWTARTFVRYRDGRRFSTDASVGFRRRHFTEDFRLAQRGEDAESVVIRWNSSYRPWSGAVNTSWLYEVQTERTPKLQEIYVKTGAEFGQFVWIDDNDDGTIQVEEFVPETTPNEGTYVRTFVPSDTLFAVIGVQARFRVAMEPDRKWKDSADRWKRWLSRISTRTTLEVAERSQEQDLRRIYLLDLSRFRVPGTTLNGRLVVRQDVELFRSRPDIGLDVSYNRIRSLTDLTAGLEQRAVTAWRASGRVRPLRRVTLRVSGSTESNRVDSESFATRRFDLRTVRVVPEISVSVSRQVQLKTELDIARKKDRLVARSSRLTKVPLELRYNRARKLQMSARLEVASIDLSGDATGIAQFELTDGRGPGTSWLWALGLQYAINRYIRASFSYDGRAPADAPALHTLRMQVSAVF